jgi:hypothetical protein
MPTRTATLGASTPTPTTTSTPGTPSPAPTESVSQQVPPEGGVVSTGTEATISDPVESSVTSPNAGEVSITETTATEPEPSGYTFFGQQINISAPTATQDQPLVMMFTIDASLIPAGQDASTIQIFRNGVEVPACTGESGTAYPTPCWSERRMLADGDAQITVLTEAASRWNFGISSNPAPRVGSISTRMDPVQVGTSVAANASFTDANSADTHTAVWIWGDGQTSPGSVTEAQGSGSVSGNHTYTEPGIYTVRLVVTDSQGGSGSSQFKYVVVYDPEGGFVTGGGWIDSPRGAYTLDQDLVGRATFGFVSRYRPGAQQPDGSTEFQFQVANLNFRSTAYDWLVISGARAQYRGAGTLNGQGNYAFMLTAIDGQVNGGGGADKFRMKIWDRNTNVVVYDNQIGAGDDAPLTTTIGGGSIVIRR